MYVLSDRGASSEAARWLAERENAADLKGGIKLDDKDAMLANVLLDLSQTASISASMVAAENVLKSLDRIGEVRKPRVQQAGFVVLKSPGHPVDAGRDRVHFEPGGRAQAVAAGASRQARQRHLRGN